MSDKILDKELFNWLQHKYKDSFSSVIECAIFIIPIPILFIWQVNYLHGLRGNSNLIVCMVICLIILTIIVYSYIDDKKEYKLLYTILFSHNNYQLIEYVLRQGALFPPISVEKLKKYDFDSNFHTLNLYRIKSNNKQLIEKMDIWVEHKILLNDELFYLKYYEDFEKIQDLMVSIQDLIYKNQQLDLPKFKNYQIKNNKKYMKYVELEKYYTEIVNYIFNHV